MKIIIIALLGSLTFPLLAHSEVDVFTTGYFFQECKSSKIMFDNHAKGITSSWKVLVSSSICNQYISGYVDSYKLFNNTPTLFCPPDGVTYKQYRLVFSKWAENHPEKLHLKMRVGLSLSLKEAFPCESPATPQLKY